MFRTQTRSWVKDAWKNAAKKKAIKKRLMFWRFSEATINGLFKKLSEWVERTC